MSTSETANIPEISPELRRSYAQAGTVWHYYASMCRNSANGVPQLLSYGGSAELMIGWDTEYVHEGGNDNRVLSYQFCAVAPNGDSWSGIHYPSMNARLSLAKVIAAVVEIGLHADIIRRWSKRVVLCGHFVTADLPGFEDKKCLFSELDTIRKTFVSLKNPIPMACYDKSRHLHNIEVVVRDSMLLAPSKRQSLANLGSIIGRDKLEVGSDYKSRMDAFLRDFPADFERYGIRDAEITVLYALRMRRLNHEVTGSDEVPITMTSIGITQLLKSWETLNINPYHVLGREVVKTSCFNGKFSQRFRKTVSLPEPHLHEAMAVETYHGARNETYLFGAAPVSDWTDQDLCGAYTTAMAVIGMPQWTRLRTTNDIADFGKTDLGYARVQFSFPVDTRFPSLPVRTEAGLIFPLSGESYCCAPEIFLARRMGAEITLREGVIIPQDFSQRPFAAFIRDATERRRACEKGSLDELFWKEMANAVYGKTAQGLRPKRCFNSRQDCYKTLPPSRITNPFLAASVTSFVRATLGEILHALPASVIVCNATTDGFLSTAGPEDLRHCISGPLCRTFRETRLALVGKDEILEEKHRVRQVLAWRTRGQATLQGFQGGKPVLAKAGLKPPMSDRNEQNEWIISNFVNRDADTSQRIGCFRSVAEICREGGDLVMKNLTRRVRMDYDWKREPRIAGTRSIRDVPIVCFDTKPWRTAAEAELCREDWQAFTRDNDRVLLSWADFEDFMAYRKRDGLLRPRRRPRKDVAEKLATRMVLRAYVRNRAGFQVGTVFQRYSDFSRWLTARGFKCKKSDVENAARRETSFEPQTVPRSTETMKLCRELQTVFPLFDEDEILEPEIRNGSRAKSTSAVTGKTCLGLLDVGRDPEFLSPYPGREDVNLRNESIC